MAADQPTYVVLETSMGAITCELYNRHAPKYVGAVDVGDRESILTYGRATGRAKTLQNLYASEYMQCYNNVNWQHVCRLNEDTTTVSVYVANYRLIAYPVSNYPP